MIFLNHEISSWKGEHMFTCVVEYPALRKDAVEQGEEPAQLSGRGAAPFSSAFFNEKRTDACM